MVVGDKRTFGVEVEVHDSPGDWLFGRFLLHVGGKSVGDPDDATDLRGCLRWMSETDASARFRLEESIEAAQAETVFRLLYDEHMAGSSVQTPLVPDAISRFHIAHLGMSSLNRFDVLLLLRTDGRNRLLWREGDGPEHNTVVEAGLINECLEDACRYLRDQISI